MNQNLKNYLLYSKFTDLFKQLPLFGLIFLVQFSTCANPRLTRYYTYHGTPQSAIQECKSVLEGLDYKIDLYDPDGAIIVTLPIKFKADIRQFEYSVFVRVQDLIEVYLVAKKSVFKRGSDWSIGGKDLIEKQSSDSMPYRIQKKIFTDISREFYKKGYKSFKRKNRLAIANGEQISQISIHYF